VRRSRLDKELVRAGVVLMFILIALWLSLFVLPDVITRMFLDALNNP
jgi:hypothetical protein